MNIPDWTMAESDLIFMQIRFTRPRGRSYPEHWRIIERRTCGEPMFAREVAAAIRKFINKKRRAGASKPKEKNPAT
jgi:hypothetical protein